jgi:hypothetical protein
MIGLGRIQRMSSIAKPKLPLKNRIDPSGLWLILKKKITHTVKSKI